MGLFSKDFRESVEMALKSLKLVIVVVHCKTAEKFAANIRTHKEPEVFALTYEDREILSHATAAEAQDYLRQT